MTKADGTHRLVLGTPEGNDQLAIEKTGSRAAWVAYTVNRVRFSAFNTVVEYAAVGAYPILAEYGNAGTGTIPFTQIQRPAYYSVAAGTTKDIYSAPAPKAL